jgi:hypothetical protein
MSGYTPVFGSIYQGTLCGKWPDAAVWASLLPLCDKHGHIDYTPQAIAALTGWPLDLLQQGIAGLCAADPHSRSAAEDGRRLVLIDPNRPWGWKVVNHSKYREKARKSSFDSARVEDGRNAERMRERRLDPTRPAMTRDDPPSNSNANTDTNIRGEARSRAHAIPQDFNLTPDREAYARAQGVPNPRETFDTFRDHFTANGKPAKDWDAAWRNWCRREKTFARSTPNRADPKPHRSVPLSDADRARVAATEKALADRAAKLAAEGRDAPRPDLGGLIGNLAASKRA